MNELINEPQFVLTSPSVTHRLVFFRGGEEVGALDFSGPKITFAEDADESAKAFFDLVAHQFASRLEQERQTTREACAKEYAEKANNNCQYPDCIENEDERCDRLLRGDCKGPSMWKLAENYQAFSS